MRYFKELIYYIIIISVIRADDFSFRGKTKEQIIGQNIPLAFTHLLSENYEILPSQFNSQRGSYLIIAPDGIINYLGDFVSFKKSQGFYVYVKGLSETGETAQNIKESIHSTLISDPMLEYVLLIGDVDGFSELPSFYYGPENDVTDQKYTYLEGDDNIPDVFIGRLSIDSLSDLAVIMSKTINYVRNPLQYNSNWLSRGIVVAGNYSNTYPIPVTPKWTSYWLRGELIDYGYSQVDTVFYPPIQQGASYIIPLINNGAGIVNYRGWGDANGWHYPEFHVDDVNDLNNGWLTPVFMSYVCNSNDFANNVDPCLAEAIIRGGTPTVPKGGVAFIGPSDLHTSTKYNNVINAYMYDAMLNHDVVELGPAMQAGQSGLVKEFPAQSGPGEAQEFYSHVYNILGDPSLQVYLNTPNQFEIEIQEFSSVDGFIKLITKDSEQNPIPNTVISIMSNNEILVKGNTDLYGEFISTIDTDNLEFINIYANKKMFIQGHKLIEVDNTEGLKLSNLTIISEDNAEKPSYGCPVGLNFQIQNQSQSETMGSFESLLKFSDGVVPQEFQLNIPQLSPGESVFFDDLIFTAYRPDIGNSIVGIIENEESDIISKISIEYNPIVLNFNIINNPMPGDSFSPSILLENFSNSRIDSVFIQLSAVSEGINLESSDMGVFSDILPFDELICPTNYNIELTDVSYGSNITILAELIKNGMNIYAQELSFKINPNSGNHPVSPSNFGYWAYDNTDIGYANKPDFDWTELDPNFGGSSSAHYQLDDDDHVDIELPFTFKYHNIDYNHITISSNGWASFVPCDINYFWNMSIPMYMGPKALLAPFSDDLETLDTDGDGQNDIWINVYTSFDNQNGTFIIEWSRALNGYDEITEETFQIILHSQNSIVTESGNGVIDFQYLEIDDVDVTKNYSTVGIESPNKNYGLQYVFNNVYSLGAAPLENGRIIRFTTDAPENYVAPLNIQGENLPEAFNLSSPHPNPFNPSTTMKLSISKIETGQIAILDILGREISVIHNGTLVPGNYIFTWNGKNKFGKLVGSGTYFVNAKYGKNSQLKKIALIK